MKYHKPQPPLEELKEYLDYNPDTGEFTWKKKTANRIKIGQEAGAICPDKGYRRIVLKKQRWQASRLAYYMYHGVDPLEKQVDHINGNRADNRIKNLRLAIHHENQCNRNFLSKNNTSGKTGVCWHKQHKKWQAQIKVTVNQKNKCNHLGYYTKKEDAIQVRIEAEKKYFGEFGPDSQIDCDFPK